MSDQRVEELTAEVREWCCEACNTIYPGPPAHGVMCVVCPKCGGWTAPYSSVKIRKLEAEVERLRASLERGDAVHRVERSDRWVVTADGERSGKGVVALEQSASNLDALDEAREYLRRGATVVAIYAPIEAPNG